MMACCIPERFVMVLMAHFGFFVVYALRVNLSVALVAMVNSTYSNVHIDPECPSNGNNTQSENNGEFNWNQNEQGLILSSFFYGYLFTQIPGGWLANKFGGKHVLGFGVLGTALLTMVTPIAAKGGITWLIVVRVLEGIGEGVTFPAMHAIMAQWSPPQEVSRMAVLTYSGLQSGTIFSLPISGLLASSTFLGGWPSAFYVFGVIGLVWYVMWLFLVYDYPNTHPRITLEERNFIEKTLKNKSSNTSNASVPWLKIFTSLPVWAITIGHFSHNWVWYMVLTGLPLYFKQVLHFNLKDNGFVSALPFIAAFITYLVAGVAADYLRKNHLSTLATRRLAGILAFYPASGFLILASYASCDQKVLSVAYMVLAVMFLSFNNVGYMVNHLDISPRFSGILMGVTNFAGTVSGCITPSVTGYFTNENPSRVQYRKVFIIAAIICSLGGTFYNVFLSGVVQPWNDICLKKETYSNDDEEEDEPLIEA